MHNGPYAIAFTPVTGEGTGQHALSLPTSIRVIGSSGQGILSKNFCVIATRLPSMAAAWQSSVVASKSVKFFRCSYCAPSKTEDTISSRSAEKGNTWQFWGIPQQTIFFDYFAHRWVNQTNILCRSIPMYIPTVSWPRLVWTWILSNVLLPRAFPGKQLD